MDTKISHAGVVDSVAEGCVKVRILQTSACASCKVAAHCNASESKEKIVDVLNVDNWSGLKVGQDVVVLASRDVANRALLLGFGLPLLLLVGVLLLSLWAGAGEGLSALLALLSLAPYYLVLFLCRDRLRRDLSFYIEQNHLN